MIALLRPLATAKNALRTVAVIAALALIAAGADFVDAKYSAEAEVVRLEQQLSDMAEANRMLTIRIDQKETAQATADAVQAELETLRSDYAMIQRAIAATKDEDDAEVAPVLRDALDDIGRMRNPHD